MAQRKALTPDGRDAQLIDLAYDVVEKRLREGTATSQETVHFLRLGNAKTRLELERLEAENKLLHAKTKAIESEREVKALYREVIDAVRGYTADD